MDEAKYGRVLQGKPDARSRHDHVGNRSVRVAADHERMLERKEREHSYSCSNFEDRFMSYECKIQLSNECHRLLFFYSLLSESGALTVPLILCGATLKLKMISPLSVRFSFSVSLHHKSLLLTVLIFINNEYCCDTFITSELRF